MKELSRGRGSSSRMLTLVLAAVVAGGQIWIYRRVRARVRKRFGDAGAWYGFLATAALSAALIVVWLDNTWVLGPVSQLPGTFARAVSLAAGIWVTGSAGAAALLFLLSKAQRRPALQDRAPAVSAAATGRRAFLLQTARAAAVATPFGAAAYGTLLLRTHFQLREVAFPARDLPPALEGLRIALLTDIHFGPYLSTPELDRAVDMANETRPHLTLVTGDFITQDGDPLDACLDRLRRLRAEAGVFGCLGNHEIYADCEDYAEVLARKKGIEILRRRARMLEFGGARLNLAGVDYQRRRRRYLAGARDLLAPGAVNLLMSHNPDVFPVAAGMGYDLVAGGHTHGGQITVEILEQTVNAGRFYTPFVAGLYRQGPASLYVSRGIGTINLPMRLGARPEVSLLVLQRA
jgi:predicted MPP superfamily phosphohydrolase